MKKVFFMAIAVCGLMMASCGTKTQNAEATSDSTAVEATDSAAQLSADGQKTVESFTTQLEKSLTGKDLTSTISTLANAETIYKNLVEAGKLEEAKAYGSALQALINEKAETIKTVASGNTTILSLVQSIQNLPTSAATTAEQAKAAVTSDVTNLASSSIAQGETTVATAEAAAEAVKNAPTTVANAAKAAAVATANNAKTAAENTANAAVTSVQNKANEQVNKASNKVNEKVTNAQNKAANKITDTQNKANKAVNDAANKALKGIGL